MNPELPPPPPPPLLSSSLNNSNPPSSIEFCEETVVLKSLNELRKLITNWYHMCNLVLELLCEARTVVSRSRPGTREKRTCAHRRHRLRHFKHKSHISKPSMPRSWIPLPSTFEETEFFFENFIWFSLFRIHRIFRIKKTSSNSRSRSIGFFL